MTQHNRQHSGWATAAKRRGEEMVACSACGKRHPRYQAQPVEYDERITPLKLLGMVVFCVAFFWLPMWFAFAAWVAQ